MRTLSRYVGRDVLLATLLIFGALLGLFAFFDLIHELGDVGRGNYTLSSALLFVALQLPSRMYELFPAAALIGTLFAMAQLVANSEYTVMRASGASLAQVTWALVRVGIPLAVATFLAGELIAPPAERLAQQIRAPSRGGRPPSAACISLRHRSSSARASSPPADAPMPTIGNDPPPGEAGAIWRAGWAGFFDRRFGADFSVIILFPASVECGSGPTRHPAGSTGRGPSSQESEFA